MTEQSIFRTFAFMRFNRKQNKMETLKFKTTINCSGCLSKVSPLLNSTPGIGQWEVNLENPDKILSVNPERATEDDIRHAVEKAGFKIEKI